MVSCLGIIYECGGKMHLSEENFQLAHTDFFEAFKCFDEAGSPRRISSLKECFHSFRYFDAKICMKP